MDVLLLHTAISLDKTGENIMILKSQAKAFYQNMSHHKGDTYEGKTSAKIAERKVKKVKKLKKQS